jgi:hypothetical protein
MGIVPSYGDGKLWALQILLLVLLAPVAVELFSTRNPAALFRSTRWMRIGVYTLLAYYGLHFYFFLYWSANHLSSQATWRMFSAGWILLFALVSVYYRVRSTESH